MVNEKLISHCKSNRWSSTPAAVCVVDADDMVAALEKGTVAWYCTDVYPPIHPVKTIRSLSPSG
jgi:D-3-phosphoglycerate dehydrogenase